MENIDLLSRLREKSNTVGNVVVLLVIMSNLMFIMGVVQVNEAVILDVIFLLITLAFIAFGKRFVYDIWEIKYIFFFSLYLLVTLFFTHGTFSSVVALVWGFIWVVVLENCKFGRKSFALLKAVFFIIFIYTFAISGGYYSNWALGNEQMNPNTLAFLLGLSSAFIMIIVDDKTPFRIIDIKILQALQVVITIIGILEYGSRGAMLMYILFVVMKIFAEKHIAYCKKYIQFIYIMIVVAGVLFPFLYIFLLNAGFQAETSFGVDKDIFTGREFIWFLIIEALSKQEFGWLIGAGSHSVVTLDGNMINTHSIYMSIFMRFGLIGLFTYFLFYYHLISKIYQKDKLGKQQKEFLFLSLSLLLYGFFEMASIGHAFLLMVSFIWVLPLTLNVGN